MKQDIDSILSANWDLIRCKLEHSSSRKINNAREFLFTEVQKALFKRTELSEIQKKVFN